MARVVEIHKQTVILSGAQIKGNDNMIVGNNNHITGNNNVIRGNANRVLSGTGNTCYGTGNITPHVEAVMRTPPAKLPPSAPPAVPKKSRKRKASATKVEEAPPPPGKVERTAPESTECDGPPLHHGDPTCVVCLDNRPTCVVLPCMQRIICVGCSQALLAVVPEQEVKCPGCRVEVQCIKRVFE